MKKALLTFAFLAASLVTNAQTEEQLVRATLHDYIIGTSNGEPERITKAFHPDLNLYTVQNGMLKERNGKEYIKLFEPGKKNSRIGEVLMIDVENDAAIAKVEISFSDRPGSYIDYFLLLKVEGHWTIIHKSYTKKSDN
jgi:hypothetical protein